MSLEVNISKILIVNIEVKIVLTYTLFFTSDHIYTILNAEGPEFFLIVCKHVTKWSTSKWHSGKIRRTILFVISEALDLVQNLHSKVFQGEKSILDIRYKIVILL